MELNNIIFSSSLILFVFFISKFFLHFFNKTEFKILKDDQFNKPQAFHENSTYRLGGLIIFLSLSFVIFYLFVSKKYFISEYISFCILFFFLGFFDDLKIDIKPKFRLFLMIIFLIFLIIFHEFKIERISLEYLDHLIKIDIFALFFVCLCFLFIINGSNLIDGFNGLLSIHSLIIFGILSLINLIHGNYNFAYLLFNLCLIIIIFIKFNFPKAQMFLGDGGAYLIGALIAISTIKTNNLIPSISSFFFCIILFYLFFEVFFSFLRKLIKEKTSPIHPDKKHLHMLLYKILLKKNNNKLKSNYLVSIIINIVYLILITPAILMMDNGLFCKYYSIVLFVMYIFSYKITDAKIK